MNPRSDEKKAAYALEGDILTISGSFNLGSISSFLDYCSEQFRSYQGKSVTINLDRLVEADSGAICALKHIRDQLAKGQIEVRFTGGSPALHQKLETGPAGRAAPGTPEGKPGFFEGIGQQISHTFRNYISTYLEIAAEITYWSMVDLFRKKTHRKGEVTNQAVQMGVNAAPIVGIMALIIGLVLALQSAAQLRTFGANIYIVDLTVIAMMSEMGPLITAIIVAGRSGSSIAAELATMNVTTETDALRTMGLNPVSFVLVPKMHAGILTMPFLVILADIMGIIGGMLIAMGSLDISPQVFLNRMEQSVYLKDIIFGMVKGLVFIYLIVITGSYFGFRADKGAAEVGKVTTRAVVVSISLVIIADSIMGLLIY